MGRAPATLGALVRLHRLRAGRTQRDLAEQTGLSIRALRAIEHDQARPRAKSMSALNAALGLEATAGRRSTARQPNLGSVPVRIGVLGPLSLHCGDTAVTLSSLMLRNLLGILALSATEVVAHDTIVDALWDGAPPKSCRNLVQVYIGQLRTLLEPARSAGFASNVIQLTGTGYQLTLADDEVDLLLFNTLTGRAAAARTRGDLTNARYLYGQALRCWRGVALAGASPRLRHHPSAVAVNERRVSTASAFADLAIREREFESAVTTLRGVVAENPLHEGLQARLVLALAGGGQQAAALHLYSEVKIQLASELGVRPGPELRAAHLSVLRQQVDQVGSTPPTLS